MLFFIYILLEVEVFCDCVLIIMWGWIRVDVEFEEFVVGMVVLFMLAEDVLEVCEWLFVIFEVGIVECE